MKRHYHPLFVVLFLFLPTPRINSMVSKISKNPIKKSLGVFDNKKVFYPNADHHEQNNSEKPKGGKLRGGNPNDADNNQPNNKQFLTSLFGGFVCGLTCGMTEGYLATDPLEIVDNLEVDFFQNNPPRSLDEAFTIHKWAQRTKQIAPIPLTWPTFWLLRRQLIHKYPNDLKWLSFFTSCFGYIVGRLSSAYLNKSTISAKKSFELNIPNLGNLKANGSFTWK